MCVVPVGGDFQGTFYFNRHEVLVDFAIDAIHMHTWYDMLFPRGNQKNIEGARFLVSYIVISHRHSLVTHLHPPKLHWENGGVSNNAQALVADNSTLRARRIILKRRWKIRGRA